MVSGPSSQALSATVAELFIPFLQQEGETSCLFLGLLSCFHLEQDFHMVIQDKSGFLPAVLQNLLPCFDEQPRGDSAVPIRSSCILMLLAAFCFMFCPFCNC